MKPIFVVLVMTLTTLLGACGTNPVTGDRELGLVSESSELDIGRQQYQPTRQMQGGDYILDPELTRYVKRVGAKLAAVSDRKLPYEFSIVNDSSPNAWALPGGKIAVNRGLLVELKNEAELAAVLGHEIVHAAARHSAQGMERGVLLQGALVAAGVLIGSSGYADYSDLALGAAALGANLVNQRYSREAELESDHYGMLYMQRAGYDPRAAIGLQETFVRLSEGQDSSWLSGLLASHPPSPERVSENRKTAKSLGAGGRLGTEQYQQMIANLRRNKPAYAAYDKGREKLDKQPEGALKLAEQAISIEPREGLFYGLKGDALEKLGRHEAALKAFDQAVARNPDFFSPYLKRGAVKVGLGEAEGARRDLQRSLDILPTAEAHYLLGIVARGEGDRSGAIKHLQIAAGSGSAVSKAAKRELTGLELARNPADYVQTALGVDSRGTLQVQVTNNTGAAVKDLVVLVGRTDSSGRIYRGDDYALKVVLRPGERIRFKTNVKGVTSAAELRAYAARVKQARPVN
ncbi:MAG: M48 family metalloprotease [Gammaproteobacteria bacterium]|nr:M48 family metalloprotease [Gammaproteobacteria bacterium]